MKLFIMKNIFLLMCFTIVLASCSTDFDTAEYYDLEELPAYVAFDADGNNATRDAEELAEDAGVLAVFVEAPTGTFSDITVNYTLSGDAVFGTDYTITGASASGGSVTISPDNDVTETFRGAIIVEALMDGVVDGNKSVVLTLTSASSADGDFAVGRGGTDFLKSAEVIIVDVDM